MPDAPEKREAQEWNDGKASTFASIYLLRHIQKEPIPLLLEADDSFLQPLIDNLFSRGYITIEKERYQLHPEGEKCLDRFARRYSEYLSFYDIFCAVDLQNGEFAFARYFDFQSDDDWDRYLAQEKWQDIRLAVARLKKMDVHEIVFMNFLSEGRFEKDQSGWQFDLLLGSIWDEIRQICRTAWSIEEIGETRLIELIRKGSALMAELLEQEGNLSPEEQAALQHYRNDPFYRSPFWNEPLL